MTSSNGNIFRVTGNLCRKFTGPRRIHRTKASDAELWYARWVNNRKAGDLRRHRAHYDVIVMKPTDHWMMVFMVLFQWCSYIYCKVIILKTFDLAFIIALYDGTSDAMSLHWRHNYHDGVSNHQPQSCLLNRLFRRRSKKTSKLRVTGLCAGNSPGSVNSPHKGPVTWKMFPFDDVFMYRAVQPNASEGLAWYHVADVSCE